MGGVLDQLDDLLADSLTKVGTRGLKLKYQIRQAREATKHLIQQGKKQTKDFAKKKEMTVFARRPSQEAQSLILRQTEADDDVEETFKKGFEIQKMRALRNQGESHRTETKPDARRSMEMTGHMRSQPLSTL